MQTNAVGGATLRSVRKTMPVFNIRDVEKPDLDAGHEIVTANIVVAVAIIVLATYRRGRGLGGQPYRFYNCIGTYV